MNSKLLINIDWPDYNTVYAMALQASHCIRSGMNWLCVSSSLNSGVLNVIGVPRPRGSCPLCARQTKVDKVSCRRQTHQIILAINFSCKISLKLRNPQIVVPTEESLPTLYQLRIYRTKCIRWVAAHDVSLWEWLQENSRQIGGRRRRQRSYLPNLTKRPLVLFGTVDGMKWTIDYGDVEFV